MEADRRRGPAHPSTNGRITLPEAMVDDPSEATSCGHQPRPAARDDVTHTATVTHVFRSLRSTAHADVSAFGKLHDYER